MESHLGGPIRLEKFVKGMQGYDGKDLVKVLEMTKKAAETLYAFIHLENADPTKYGSRSGITNIQIYHRNDSRVKSTSIR